MLKLDQLMTTSSDFWVTFVLFADVETEADPVVTAPPAGLALAAGEAISATAAALRRSVLLKALRRDLVLTTTHAQSDATNDMKPLKAEWRVDVPFAKIDALCTAPHGAAPVARPMVKA